MANLMDVIKSRKSVRTFDGRYLTPEHRAKLEAYAENIRNPFGIPVNFVFMDAKECGLSSPVITGEKLYLAGKVEKKPYADVAFGYTMEKLVLYAWSMGIGTTWIAGTMKRADFEAACGLKEGEMMPCVSPLGYPAKNRALKEVLMRKGVRADTRLSAEQVFFRDAWDTPLGEAEAADIHPLMDMVLWAPSAVNKQPWRVILSDGKFHFYEKKDKGYVNENTGDLQKIDIGIALAHLALGMKERGRRASVTICDPGIAVPEGVEYIATVTAE